MDNVTEIPTHNGPTTPYRGRGHMQGVRFPSPPDYVRVQVGFQEVLGRFAGIHAHQKRLQFLE